jgi:hypothetical protein
VNESGEGITGMVPNVIPDVTPNTPFKYFLLHRIFPFFGSAVVNKLGQEQDVLAFTPQAQFVL